MPKTPTKKKSTARKPTPKTTLKKKKPTARKAAAVPHSKQGFMWKLLEHKQAELKRMHVTGTPKHPFAHADAKPAFTPKQGHSRFAGPRRKAA